LRRGLAPFLVLILVSACAPARAADPSSPPTDDPSAGLVVPAGPVLFEPEQLIYPPEDFPLASAEVLRDAPIAAHAWERQFATPASADFRWFTLRLFVLEPDTSSTRFVAENGCGSVNWPDERAVPYDLAAPRTGEGSVACGYRFADGARVVYYTTGYRNVGIMVAAQPRRAEVSDDLAVKWLSSIARGQIAIIGRLLAVARL
jgi:hypothetical protein